MTPHPAPFPPCHRLRLALLSALVASACAAQAALPAPDAGGGATINPARWPQPAWPVAKDAALERRLEALLATLTVEEKVGQVIQADIGSITPEDLRKYRLGSILAGGGSDPGGSTTPRRRTGWRWPMRSGKPRWTPRRAARRSR